MGSLFLFLALARVSWGCLPSPPPASSTSPPENPVSDPTQDVSKKDWQTIDLGNVCDCWSKEKSNEAARVDKTKLDKYSSSFEAASTKHNIPKEVLMAVA